MRAEKESTKDGIKNKPRNSLVHTRPRRRESRGTNLVKFGFCLEIGPRLGDISFQIFLEKFDILVCLLVAMTGQFVIALAGNPLLFSFVDFHRRVIEHFLPGRIEATSALLGQSLFRQRHLVNQISRMI